MEYRAVFFQRNCGATEGYKPGLSILLGDEELDSDDRGNVFECYRCDYVDFEWLSEGEILIRYSAPSGTGLVFETPDGFVQNKLDFYLGISIEYQLIKNP